MTELTTCPNCNKKLSGFLRTGYFVKESTVEFINNNTELNSSAYCDTCASPIIIDLREKGEAAVKHLKGLIESKISLIPILTLNHPNNWEYEPIELVSSQSVIGTGFSSEISSSWNDLLGSESNSMNDKIKRGEDVCKDKIRLECAMLGGNAVIATDVDYSEVGSGKGMLMVCMSGTSINVSKWSGNYINRQTDLTELTKNTKELLELSKIKYPDLL